ncbi:receptor-like protein EIX2 [Silene latifolia]|uniref:receptor-like protein EIX2 n=1 Tax=Silene latifolia TaxID=37657 RepID=UPI003D788482
MNHLLVLLLLCLWLTYFSSHARSGTHNNNNNNNNTGINCVESERDALLRFKGGITVDQCGLLDSWGVTQDCCLWRGIRCDSHSGRISALNLPMPQNHFNNDDVEFCLKGTFGVSLLELKHLKYLNLSCNYFGGQLPKFIGSLSNLEHLDLSYVGFTGVVPHEIGNLSKLLSLNLHCPYHFHDCDMKVESLRWLSQLRLLRELDLGGIDLSLTTNNWLSIVNKLPHLQVLRLDSCKLSLNLPSSDLSYINSSTTLDTISLSFNNLNDTSIFEWLSNLNGLEISLVYLDLSDNYQLFRNNFQLSNTWNFLGNLCSLQILRLRDTGLKYNFSEIIQFLSACSHQSLMRLNLSQNQLWGFITDNIGNLSYLREFFVYENQLNGTITEALGRLPLLERLDLSSNSLNGVFTSVHLSKLSKLSYLSLSNNMDMVVNISANWVPPFQLQALDLSSCKVGPDFPMWLITQKNLTIINISNTSISSMIPNSFFNSLSPKLEVLIMSQNMMYGALPNPSITFDSTVIVDLSSNNFVGTIPPFLNYVTVLYLNDNHFSQGFVSFFCPQAKRPLIVLDLSNNSFSEKLPDCWGYFDNLLVLRLKNNKIWGNLPSSIGSLNKLSLLHLSNNNLSGKLPASLLNCKSLISLDLAYNSLSGYIPYAIGNYLKNLSIMTLQYNNFYGALPSSLCHLTRLQILDLSNNHISGTIPRCIYNLQGMVNINNILQYTSFHLKNLDFSIPYDLTDNPSIMWKRKEQNFGGGHDSVGLVKAIDLSSNLLEGHIPDEISSLIGLVSINFSSNHLSGVIPSRIGQLTALQSLDLSHNQISSEIPTSLAKISYLGVLDLSYNNLFGKIPDGTQLQSFDISAYMGNPGLCGAPLPKCHEDEGAITPKNIDKEQPSDNFMLGVYISVVLGFIFGFWGVCGVADIAFKDYIRIFCYDRLVMSLWLRLLMVIWDVMDEGRKVVALLLKSGVDFAYVVLSITFL